MKILVHIKDSDAFDEGVQEAVKKHVQGVCPVLDDEERAPVIEIRTRKAWEFLGRWVTHGEYVILEFDTEDGTARLLGSDEAP